MELIIIWLSSILIYLITEKIVEVNMIKDIADIGYKIKFEQVKTIIRTMNFSNDILSFIISIIPGVNLISSLLTFYKYKYLRYMLMEYVFRIGFLPEMSQKEYEKYEEKPNVLKALLISYDKSKEINNSNKYYRKVLEIQEEKTYLETQKQILIDKKSKKQITLEKKLKKEVL